VAFPGGRRRWWPLNRRHQTAGLPVPSQGPPGNHNVSFGENGVQAWTLTAPELWAVGYRSAGGASDMVPIVDPPPSGASHECFAPMCELLHTVSANQT
jgi:hypothetical protein